MSGRIRTAYKSSFSRPKNYHGNLFLNYRRHNVVGVPVVYRRLYRVHGMHKNSPITFLIINGIMDAVFIAPSERFNNIKSFTTLLWPYKFVLAYITNCPTVLGSAVMLQTQ